MTADLQPSTVAIEHVDTVVIGAGAIGCAIAWFRAADSDSVVVLERDQVGLGASFGNTGHLTPSDAWPLSAPGVVRQALAWSFRRDVPFSLERRLKREYLAWLVSFARWSRRGLSERITGLWELGNLSLDLTRELAQSADISLLQDQGVLNLYTTAPGLKGGREMAETLMRHGVPAQMLSSDEAGERADYRGTVAGGVLYPQDALCSPFDYVSGLARSARARGVDIREGVSVESIGLSGSGDRVFVRTSTGTLAAESVVIAAGVDTPRLARPFGAVPIVVGQGYGLDVALEPAPSMPILFPEWRIASSPLNGFVRFAGVMDLVTAPRGAAPARAAYLEEKARTAFGYASRFEPRPAWTGMRSCTPDGLPIIDALDPNGRVIVAAGHNMLGMTLAAGTGQLVAQRLAGEATRIDVRPFALGRFRR